MKLNAIKVNHGKKLSYVGEPKDFEIFICSIKIKDLIDESQIRVDRWKYEKQNKPSQGYQRIENPKHIKNIKRAIFQNGIDFPTSILLSYRKEGNKKPNYSYNEENREIKINEFPVYLVDGQHRVAAIRESLAELTKIEPAVKDIELSAVLMVGLDRYEEMQYFETINSTAKRVQTDLANELLLEKFSHDPTMLADIKMQKKAWLVKAVKVAHALNDNKESPWSNRIKMPNQTDEQKGKDSVASQSQFAVSLKPLLENGFLQTEKLDTVMEVINAYWVALRDIFPDAFKYPRKHVIQKTVGIFSLNALLNNIIPKLMKENKELNPKNFQKILKEIFEKCGQMDIENEHENSKFWQSGRRGGAAIYRGQAGFKELHEIFLDTLDESLE